MSQPVPNVTAADVARIVRRDYGEARSGEVLALLERYGAEGGGRELARVRLAVLKLAAGDLAELQRQLEVARLDYRDVIAPAEYPAYARHGSGMARLPADERRRIIEADREQYARWLGERPG